MKAGLRVLVAGAGLALFSGSMLAHHSFDAQYDRSQTIPMTGVVTKVEWLNPHARFYIDVEDESGAVVNWNMELGSPNGLTRAGWSRHTLQIGEKVVVMASLAIDGTNMANAREITMADGKQIFTASSAGPL